MTPKSTAIAVISILASMLLYLIAHAWVNNPSGLFSVMKIVGITLFVFGVAVALAYSIRTLKQK